MSPVRGEGGREAKILNWGARMKNSIGMYRKE
jgi:hypothetical protein